MKRFALLRLHNNANTVIFDCYADTVLEAVKQFNPCLTNMPQLSDDGYCKVGDITFCVAEYHQSFATLP